MSVKLRPYSHKDDFKPVGDFLVENYLPDNQSGNFFEPAWEYIHGHPWFDEKPIDKMGIWEDSGKIIAVAHYELTLGTAFFEIRREYHYLKPAMLDYAEKHLCDRTPEGRTYLKAYVNSFDSEFEDIVTGRGYLKDTERARPLSKMKIPPGFKPEFSLPNGFKLKSQAEDNDLAKLNRVLFRGFNHGDEPPAVDYAARHKQQSVPHYRKDLNIIVVAPDGDYAAYAGTWFEATNRFCYIEPVCTDPAYRRLGLGKAAVLEGIRRCGELGATVAYVGSIQPFYLSFGFEKLFTCNCWTKYWD